MKRIIITTLLSSILNRFVMHYAKNKISKYYPSMRKNISLIILVFVIQTITHSQPCLPEGITFSNQSEIDNFQINNPNCTEILGNVVISGDNIKNLNNLNVLTSINGKFQIRYNDSLWSLSGLESLTNVGKDFEIEYNNKLTNLTGLSKLSSIEGDFILRLNNAMVNTVGLNTLSYIEETFLIWSNNNLVDFSGLNSLVEIGGYLYAAHNPSLLSMTGLDNIQSVGGISISQNNILPSLTGIDSIHSLQEGIYITENNSLININSLMGITSINGEIWLQWNPLLNSLEGLANIDPNSITGLVIFSNPSLSKCEVNSVCQYLDSPTGILLIEGNKSGCHSQAEVIEQCSISVGEFHIQPDFVLYPNPATNEVSLMLNSSNNQIAYSIYNLLGQRVLQDDYLNNKIDLSKLENGIYFVELSSNNFKVREKLIIEK